MRVTHVTFHNNTMLKVLVKKKLKHNIFFEYYTIIYVHNLYPNPDHPNFKKKGFK